MKLTPANCPHCEYDRRFPGFEAGGWMQQDNNGPIVSCPVCNDKGIFPFEPYEQEDRQRAIELQRHADDLEHLDGMLDDRSRES